MKCKNCDCEMVIVLRNGIEYWVCDCCGSSKVVNREDLSDKSKAY